MARYDLVPVFLAPSATDAQGRTYAPGLYALRGPSDRIHVYADFFDRYDDPQERRRLWAERPGLREHYETFAEFEADLLKQLADVDDDLEWIAQSGRLLSPPDWGAFTDIRAGARRASETPGQARKFRSLRRGGLSLIRLYGLHYGRDLVLVTAAAVKTTRRNDEDPRLRTIIAETERWSDLFYHAGVRPSHFQAYNTLPVLLDDETI